MEYYLKNPKSGDVEGPFAIELLNRMIAQSEIGSDFLATSNLGEPLAQIKNQRSHDWVSLGSIPGIRGIPPSQKEQALRFSTETRIALVLIFIAILAIAFWWLVKAGIASGLSDS